MDENHLRELIEQVRSGDVAPDDAVRELRRLPFADMGFARIDHHRDLRQELPEAIYAPGKSVDQCVAITGELLSHGNGPVILSRADEAQATATMAAYAGGERVGHTVIWRSIAEQDGRIAVLTAGTADLPVAEECMAVLAALGYRPHLVTDVGVAGIHRLLASIDALDDIDVAVVVAGMEGALASVVGGITSAPVVAVPTSVGYGSSFQGITALLAMLSSCAAGVSVVGIDNGFGAAAAVSRLLSTGARRASLQSSSVIEEEQL